MKYKLQTGVNNLILRTASESVVVFDGGLKEFADDLMNLMYKWDGVGLAAPQVGHNKKVIAVTQRKGEKIVRELLMVNPKITWSSGKFAVGEEGCLSVPEFFGHVKRDLSIVVQYQDVYGRSYEKKFKQMDARVIQHEVDHLDGILFVDKLVEKK